MTDSEQTQPAPRRVVVAEDAQLPLDTIAKQYGVCIRPVARQNIERCPAGAPPPSKRAGVRPGDAGSDPASKRGSPPRAQ